MEGCTCTETGRARGCETGVTEISFDRDLACPLHGVDADFIPARRPFFRLAEVDDTHNLLIP